MKKLTITLSVVIFIPVCLFNVTIALAWHDETHLAVAKAAGYNKWYNTTSADITKIKAGSIERLNHFFNNPLNVAITPERVLKQVIHYNNPNHLEGHLYGAILASLREYKTTYQERKYAEYHLAFCAHYITDLSQPLHNVPYDDFNRTHHVENDGIVNGEVLARIHKIREQLYPIHLNPEHFEEDLAAEIARIANKSRMLGHKLKAENRNMTKEEAYIQLGHSASLLKAVLDAIGKL